MQRWILRERCGGKLTCTLSFLLPSPRCSMNQLTRVQPWSWVSVHQSVVQAEKYYYVQVYSHNSSLTHCWTVRLCPCATGLLTSRLSLSKTYCCVTTSVQFLSTSSPRWVSSQPFSLTRAVTCALKASSLKLLIFSPKLTRNSSIFVSTSSVLEFRKWAQKGEEKKIFAHLTSLWILQSSN